MTSSRLVRALPIALLCACAAVPARTHLGDITVRSRENQLSPPVTLGVQNGRILAGDVDIVLETDGCVRGAVRSSMVSLCPTALPPDPSAPEGTKAERWSGATGNFVLEVAPDGKTVRADGFLRGPARGRRQVARASNDGGDNTLAVAVTLPFGKGPEWDELRQHPALYVVAAALRGARGDSLLIVPLVEPKKDQKDEGPPVDTEDAPAAGTKVTPQTI
ncbi:MAG: hypothetical protein JST92_27770 [Deltaproteobacteria bacterium]|nr:hypothetical protein [Deltaproteobacteria bacterium]